MKKAFSIILAFVLSMTLFSTALGGIPEEYIGKWAGVSGHISLIFEISADGRGRFTLTQFNYTGTNDAALSVEDETFTVEIPEDDKITESCRGSYSYADGVLTVNVEVVFVGGRVYSYTVPCERVKERVEEGNAGTDTLSLTIHLVRFGDALLHVGEITNPKANLGIAQYTLTQVFDEVSFIRQAYGDINNFEVILPLDDSGFFSRYAPTLSKEGVGKLLTSTTYIIVDIDNPPDIMNMSAEEAEAAALCYFRFIPEEPLYSKALETALDGMELYPEIAAQLGK